MKLNWKLYNKKFRNLATCRANDILEVILRVMERSGLPFDDVYARVIHLYSQTVYRYEQEDAAIEAAKEDTMEREFWDHYTAYLDQLAHDTYPDVYDNDPSGAEWLVSWGIK